MKNWFNNLKHNEQWMIVVCGCLVAVYLLYSVIWLPMKTSQRELAIKNEQAAKTLVSVRSLAQEYQALKGLGQSNAKQSTASLASIVDSTVAANKLVMSRFQPSSTGDAQVRFENVPFNQLLSWLYQIETDHAVVVRDLSVSSGGSGGLVNVSIRVGKGA